MFSRRLFSYRGARSLFTYKRARSIPSYGPGVNIYLKWGAAAGVVAIGSAQLMFGSTDVPFYTRTFIADLDTQDAGVRDSLTEFFGGEGIMDIYCVFSWCKKLVMQTGYWDDDGMYHTLFGGNHLSAAIGFEEEGEDITGDGEIEATSFTKIDYIRDELFGMLVLDIEQEFGFTTLDDGRIEVFIRGASFKGFFPLRFFFQILSFYHIWAMKTHINSDAFSNARLEGQREEQPHNIPLHVLKDFLTGLTYDVSAVGGDDVDELQDALEELQERLTEQREEMEELKAQLKLREHESAEGGARTHAQIVVNDAEMQKILQNAMRHVSENSKNQWTLRTVTPTWIDGKDTSETKTSQAWSTLLEHPDLKQEPATAGDAM